MMRWEVDGLCRGACGVGGCEGAGRAVAGIVLMGVWDCIGERVMVG